MKVCSFFGHTKIENTENLKSKLYNLVENLIVNKNVSSFCFGGLGMFDALCLEIVCKLKEKYPHIRRVLYVHDPRLLRKFPPNMNRSDFEAVEYMDLEFDWWYTRIYFRNCRIIDYSDFVVFYVHNTNNSGAYKALQYARKNKKRIFNIYEMI